MVIDKKRYTRFSLAKIIGTDRIELHLLADNYNGYKQLYNIPLGYGGKSATSIGDIRYGPNMVEIPIKRYSISFDKLSEKLKEKVRKDVFYIEKNGNPIENDEHIFG